MINYISYLTAHGGFKKLSNKFCAAGLMFGLVGFKSRFSKKCGGGGGNPNICLFIFFFIRLWLGCIPKISFVTCLKVPKKFLWVVVVGGYRVKLVIALA
jgi:hypothetical protein